MAKQRIRNYAALSNSNTPYRSRSFARPPLLRNLRETPRWRECFVTAIFDTEDLRPSTHTLHNRNALVGSFECVRSLELFTRPISFTPTSTSIIGRLVQRWETVTRTSLSRTPATHRLAAPTARADDRGDHISGGEELTTPSCPKGPFSPPTSIAYQRCQHVA